MTTYERIDAELSRQRKNWAWLARAIGYSSARIGNWKSRGVPASAHALVAAALGQSLDWVAGRVEPIERPHPAISPMARKIAQEFDLIQDQQAQIDAFARIIAVIARAGT